MSTEYVCYSREDIENILRNCATMRLIGRMYVGTIGTQELRWLDNGGAEILTHHVPADLPQAREQPPRKKRAYHKRIKS